MKFFTKELQWRRVALWTIFILSTLVATTAAAKEHDEHEGEAHDGDHGQYVIARCACRLVVVVCRHPSFVLRLAYFIVW
jgi:hypothetical protein